MTNEEKTNRKEDKRVRYWRIVFTSGLILCLSFIFALAINANSSPDGVSADVSLQDKLQQFDSQKRLNLPVIFVPNRGQFPADVAFAAVANGAAVWFSKDAVYYHFSRPISGQKDKKKQLFIKSTIVNANPEVRIVGENQLAHRRSYFTGNDPNEWYAGLPTYGAILHKDIYPGIDLRYYGNEGEIEFDFLVAAGADPSAIEIRYQGVESLAVNKTGELLVETAWGTIVARQPIVYQPTADGHTFLTGQYQLLSENSFSFSLSDDCQSSLPLVIDPVISYSTYLGGGDFDLANSVAIDGEGNIYVTGETHSPQFPHTDQALDTSYNLQGDAFVAKFAPSGLLIYSTFLGGNGFDKGRSIDVDEYGNVYISGSTASTNFPTANALKDSLDGINDAFVVKLSSTGDALIYSTYLGGSASEEGSAITVDQAGCVYLSGVTSSPDFPTINSVQDSLAGMIDLFLVKLTATGNMLSYSTYLGSSLAEEVRDIAINQAGQAYVTGKTSSSDFPTVNAYQDSSGGTSDAFVVRLAATGDSLIYSTYLGGLSGDGGWGIDIDSLGSAFVVGGTYSTDFPTTAGALQTHLQGTSDAFAVKITPAGDALSYSTLLGGTGGEWGYGGAVDQQGCFYLTGQTNSSDFPLVDSIQAGLAGSDDAFVAKLNNAGSSLLFGTYLGGSSDDYGSGLAVTESGVIHLIGGTTSHDFPLRNPLQGSFAGVMDGFVAKIVLNPCPSAPPQITPIDTFLVRFNHRLAYAPQVTDPDDLSHTISYLNYPVWCQVIGDSLIGNAPAQVVIDSVTVVAADLCNADTMSFAVKSYLCGDANPDNAINIGDVVAIIVYIFQPDPDPVPVYIGDVDCDSFINIGDVVYIIAYIFVANAPAPCEGPGC
ncbi:MAG: SBBP repeat-containing protein [candidate division Zixibacteria bacterium]|nr:SBBP repeat-containing protein [candidate division Zixibacteria bacterium]